MDFWGGGIALRRCYEYDMNMKAAPAWEKHSNMDSARVDLTVKFKSTSENPFQNFISGEIIALWM